MASQIIFSRVGNRIDDFANAKITEHFGGKLEE
jgi:hypothetical protein